MDETKDLSLFPTLMEIKKSIPNHCFESSTLTSMYFVVRSFVFSLTSLAVLYWARNSEMISNITGLTECITLLYIFVQGVVFWGYFTIGHDCGHGSFSRYHWLNSIVGNIMHSIILTPFETWRMSHRHHHKNTGNIDKDEIFYPHRKSEKLYVHTRKSIYYLGGAWFLYLVYGYPSRDVPHFNPWNSMFVRNFTSVVLSLSIYGVFASLYAYLAYTCGINAFGVYYLAPLFVFASFLVVTTFLHHNHEDTPWYADSEWTYVKGNLSSIDRSYGKFIDNISHNIGTHQIHHLFPIIPHYKLNEATEYFRQAFPHLTRQCNDSIMSSFAKTLHLYVKNGECEADTKVFTLGTAAKSKAE